MLVKGLIYQENDYNTKNSVRIGTQQHQQISQSRHHTKYRSGLEELIEKNR